MKKIYLVLFTALFSLFVRGQATTANNAFSTNTSSSLIDMSTGTSTLIAANVDDGASAVTNIGFDFFLNGARYTQFSVNSNGTLRLGATAASTTGYNPLGQASQALITSFGADQRTHTSGKVHYKVTGTAPNRVLVVEWLNMQSDFNSGGTADLTYQLLLSEGTGVIQSIYGTMNMGALGAADANSNSPQFGFSTSNTVGTVGTLTAPQSGTPAPTYGSASATPVDNLYTAGTIPVLTSAADGSRRSFSYASPVPADPTGLSFTGVTPTTMTLNWADNATNETGYVIYRSTDGTNFTFITIAAANSTTYASTGLLDATLYYWRVYAVSEGALSNVLAGSQATPAANVIVSNGTGLWSNPATWSPAVVPGVDDAVTIRDGDVVTIDVAANAYRLTVGQGVSGTLQFEDATARTLTVATDVTIASGATFQSALTGTQAGHNLSVGGNLTNNGTLDFSTSADVAGAMITFTGSLNSAFSGTGATTDIRQITINKSGISAITELNTSNFTVRGTNTDVVVGGFLVITSGTFKISGNFAYTGRMYATATYTIPAAAGVWLNNPNFVISGQNASATLGGLLRVTQGTYNIGTATGNSLGFSAGSSVIVEGGTIISTSRFGVASAANAISYTQTGGTITVNTIGNTSTTLGSFDLGTSLLSNITLTGGTIINQLAATTIDYRNQAGGGIANVTGGTLQMGNAASGAAKNFNIRGVVPNLVVTNISAGHTVTYSTTLVNYNNIFLNLTIDAGATFNAGNVLVLWAGPTITNNGTLTHNGASSNFIVFGTISQNYTGNGVVTSPMTTLAMQGTNFTIDAASPGFTVNALRFFSGNIINSGKLTIGSGAATTAVVQIGNTTTPTDAGTLDQQLNFNPGTGGITLSYLRTTNARTTGFEIPVSRNITTLTVDENDLTHPLTINGGDLNVSTTYTQTNGNIITAGNNMVLGTSPTAAGTFTYTSGTIIGKFKRWIGTTTGNRDFPVGISIAKRNASINFTDAPTTGGTLTAQWIGSPAGVAGLPLTEGALNVTSTSNDGYWSVVAGDGLTGGTYTGTFTATGIAGITNVAKLVLVKRTDVNAPWTLEGTHVTTTGTVAAPILQRTGLTSFSEFGVGSDDFIVLPVTLLNLTGRKLGKNNQLQWATASEQDNRGFEILSSTDGSNFVSKGFVSSQAVNGTSSIRLNYSFTDVNPTGAVQQYRLRQVDANGRNKYSNIIVMKAEQAAALSISGVFPNPAVNVINLQVSVKVKDNMSIVVTDINGRKLLVQQANIEAGSTNVPLTITKLPAGTYTVRLLSSDGKEQSAAARFVKQ